MLYIDQATDTLLVNKVKDDNDEKALEELIVRHSGIYVHMIKRFGGKSLNNIQINDMLDDKNYQIYKAALEFDDTKSKFSTYLAIKTKYLCLTHKTNNKKNSNIFNFDDFEFSLEDKGYNPSETLSRNEFLSKIFSLIENHQDLRVKTIFKERYFSNTNGKLKAWKDIAQKVDLSIQGCINIHNKTIKEFQEKITDEQFTF
jgi:DNA-directed RNA polymerase specialized sigma24 family protein